MLRFPFLFLPLQCRSNKEADQAACEEAPIVGWNIKSGQNTIDNLEIGVNSFRAGCVPPSLLFAPLLLTAGAAQRAQSVRQPTHKRVTALSAPPRPLLSATCRALPPPPLPLLLIPTASAFLSSSGVLLSFSARSLEGGVRLECQESLE